MAIVTIRYSCGCGAHMPKTEDALAHCDKLGHIITVSGIIKPTIARKPHTIGAQQAAQIAQSVQRTAHTPHWSSNPLKEPEELSTSAMPPIPPVDFSSLRKKILGPPKRAQTEFNLEGEGE